MRTQAVNVFATALLVAAFLVQATTADARAIRIDGAIWQDSESEDADSEQEIGFEFDLFGARFSRLTIHTNGSVSFGDSGGIIAPFLDNAHAVSYSFSRTDPNEPLGSVLNAFRIEWGNDIFATEPSDPESTANAFQLTLFKVASGQFVMEFNYGRLFAGSDASEIFYDNGAGAELNLLAALGLLPEPFDKYQSIADNYTIDPVLCDTPGQILSCNNYFNGVFGLNALDGLPATLSYFGLNPSNADQPVQGRYVFVTGESTVSVPEPGVLSLIVIALGGAGLARRRRR